MTSYQVKLQQCAAAKDMAYVKHLFFVLIEHFDLHIREVTQHHFYLDGFSVAAVLAEGHVFMHAHPSEEKIDFDLYCRDGVEHDFAERFFDEILSVFGAKSLLYVITDRVSMRIIDQGYWIPT